MSCPHYFNIHTDKCWFDIQTGGEPAHHCKVPEGQSINVTIPIEVVHGEVRLSRCEKYVNFSVSNRTMECDQGWHYDDEYDSTIVTEVKQKFQLVKLFFSVKFTTKWQAAMFHSFCFSQFQWDLVCDKNYLAETSQSVFNFGVMVGAVVFTTMADKIGRKPVHLGCQYAMVVVGLAIAFSPNYITFVILRFLLGAIREVWAAMAKCNSSTYRIAWYCGFVSIR